ncbi:MAG: trypsin-like peptidase domain-containing protein [Deltaproteobacteria bacterium]|nr:trypsin-like peptidase domain-containing protein [Deltaproteobacteria bacterium]
MKRSFRDSSTCIAILLFTYNVYGQNVDFLKTIEHAKRSVLAVVCMGQNPDTKSLYLISVDGSGFFASDDGSFVTAGHVAKGLFALGRIPTCPVKAVYVPLNNWDTSKSDVDLRIIPIKRCWWNDNVDVGVCTLAVNPFLDDAIKLKPVVADFDTSVQPDGTPVAFTGFPLSFIQPITSQGIVGTYRNATDVLGPKEMMVDKNAWPGASGSPVYLSNGKVVGLIVQRGFNDASGLAFARTSFFIKDFLAKNKADREAQEQKEKQR